jgi:hypothetical protein
MTSLTYEKAVNAAWLTGAASMLLMPDVIFGLLLEALHLALEFAHILFELVESALDHWVEHTFHTGTRETQIIVFYLIVSMGAIAAYFVYRKISLFFRVFKESLLVAFLRHKTRVEIYWAASAHNKFKIIAGFNLALGFVVLFGF